jgi:hypothetical protein
MSAHEHLNPRLFDPGRRLSEDQIDARRNQRTGQELATFGEIAVSAPISATTPIADTGALLTQHETGYSMGEYDPVLREEVENRMEYENSPVYGALAQDSDDHTHYGSLSLHLRSSVKDRATMYPGDSLNDLWDASEPDFPPPRIADVASGEAAPLAPMTPFVPYTEAHVHADPSAPDTLDPSGRHTRVPLRDIHRAVLHESSALTDEEVAHRNVSRPRQRQMGGALHDAGVPVFHSLSDRVEQPNLPMDYGSTPVEPKVGNRRRLVRHEDMAEQKDLW